MFGIELGAFVLLGGWRGGTFLVPSASGVLLVSVRVEYECGLSCVFNLCGVVEAFK